MSCWRQAARISSRRADWGGFRNTAPMAARRVLADQASAHPSDSTTGTSRASAVRRIVPRFPGSWMPSRIRQPGRRVRGCFSGIRPTKSAPWGLPCCDSHAISSRLTRSSRTPWGSWGSARPSTAMTSSSPSYQAAASARSLVPSAANCPVCWRKLRDWSSLRVCWITWFCLLVINIVSSSPIPAPAGISSCKKARGAGIPSVLPQFRRTGPKKPWKFLKSYFIISYFSPSCKQKCTGRIFPGKKTRSRNPGCTSVSKQSVRPAACGFSDDKTVEKPVDGTCRGRLPPARIPRCFLAELFFIVS